MYAWAPLQGVNDSSNRKTPEEERWYKVSGRVTEVRVQQDGDIHFELADATGKKRGHILAEVPISDQAIRALVIFTCAHALARAGQNLLNRARQGFSTVAQTK